MLAAWAGVSVHWASPDEAAASPAGVHGRQHRLTWRARLPVVRISGVPPNKLHRHLSPECPARQGVEYVKALERSSSDRHPLD